MTDVQVVDDQVVARAEVALSGCNMSRPGELKVTFTATGDERNNLLALMALDHEVLTLEVRRVAFPAREIDPGDLWERMTDDDDG